MLTMRTNAVRRRDLLVIGMPSTEKTNDASRRDCTATVSILRCVRNISGRVMISDAQRFPRIGDKGNERNRTAMNHDQADQKERRATKNKESLGLRRTTSWVRCASWDRREEIYTLQLDRDPERQEIRHVCA